MTNKYHPHIVKYKFVIISKSTQFQLYLVHISTTNMMIITIYTRLTTKTFKLISNIIIKSTIVSKTMIS